MIEPHANARPVPLCCAEQGTLVLDVFAGRHRAGIVVEFFRAVPVLMMMLFSYALSLAVLLCVFPAYPSIPFAAYLLNLGFLVG